jgi:transmembrane sensor
MSAGESATDLNSIDLEALRWVHIMERGPLSGTQERELNAWSAADVRHQGALIRAQAAALSLKRLSALAAGRSPIETPTSQHITRRGAIALAASAAGALGLLGWENREWFEDLWAGTPYSSAVGEMKKVVLPDGSLMTLNTESEVRAHYTRHSREIHLTKGEVLFTVAHDAAREFVVRVGTWALVAMGTAFAVRRLNPTSMDIMVTEGIVEMLPRSPGVTAKRQKLTALQEASVNDSQVATHQLSDQELQRRLAWRMGLIVFEGETLRQVLSEMNRYSHRRFVVTDPELADRRIVGVFPTSDTQTFVQGMRATLGVEPIENGNTLLLQKKTRAE